MRTLHLITDRDRRGAQVHAIDLAEGLRAVGVDATVIALAPGVHDDRLDVDVLGPRRLSYSTVRGLRRRAKDFDVVVAHGSTTLTVSALGLPRSLPFAYRQISDPLFWAGSLPRRVRTGAFLRRASAIVALAAEVAEVFSSHYRLPRSRITVIPNAVPSGDVVGPSSESRRAVRSRLGVPDGCFVGITLGALVPEKGVDAAVRAIASVERTHLLVVGDGPEREALVQLAASLAPERLHFLGAVDEPLDLLRAADAVLFPSSGGDSMPAALIEAGLVGIPAVATPVGAVEEIVVDGQTGVITPIGDQSALCSAVRQLQADGDRRRSMGAAARRHCSSRFTIEAVVPTWIALLERVNAGWSGTGRASSLRTHER